MPSNNNETRSAVLEPPPTNNNDGTSDSTYGMTDFFTTHEERGEEDQPELNTGFDDDVKEDINIGWGNLGQGTNNTKLPDKDIDLEVNPFETNNNITLRELSAALGNLTLDQEINGDSSSLPSYNNSNLPMRTQSEMNSVNKNIRNYVQAVKRHRNKVDLTASDHMNYLEILVEMNQSNAPQSLFDNVARLFHKNFDPQSISGPPTQGEMLTWIERQVYPEEL